jgi:EAL domain-containing protein (putative c-di-GMP-specific phosphodiesterase class I)
MFLSVNLSARQFAQPDLVGTVSQVLRESGLPSSLLKLELTESALMGDPEAALAAMRRLKALGVSLAIDDFGTGYSSLSYLQRFPVDVLKIDRAFVRDLPCADADGRALVGAISALAESLRLTLVAEGVETGEQLEILAAIGCEAVQGYLFHPPLSGPSWKPCFRFRTTRAAAVRRRQALILRERAFVLAGMAARARLAFGCGGKRARAVFRFRGRTRKKSPRRRSRGLFEADGRGYWA